MNEPELPPLPAREQMLAAARPSLLVRKRTHSEYDPEPGTSSDPATFSSDETAPGAENYTSGKRKKRTFRGAWWDRQPAKMDAKADQKKRKFRRNFDSGIFMGSESEEALSSDSFTMEEEFLREQENAKEQNQNARSSKFWSLESSQTTPSAFLAPKDVVAKPAEEHQLVFDIIHQCLENGKEDVDLSSLSLSDLPLELVSLNTLSKQDELCRGMLHIGTSLEPRLRLFLGNNHLHKVPSPILELRNLRSLSLRNNKLTSIPPGIRDLVNLESLNIAGNELQLLPLEVLNLVTKCRLKDIILDPNPWLVPDRETLTSHEIRGLGSDLGAFRRGNVTLLRVGVMDCPSSTTPPSLISTVVSAVPSLTELVLRQLAKIDPTGETDFGAFMPSGSPEAVLDHLSFLRTHSDCRCNSCSRPIVHAAKTVIEWWNVGTSTYELHSTATLTVVPFQRFTCWEGCRGKRESGTVAEA